MSREPRANYNQLRTTRQLAKWIAIGTTTAASIPTRRRLIGQTLRRHAS